MNKKLPKEAYGGIHGKKYVPYISNNSNKGANLSVIIIGIIYCEITLCQALFKAVVLSCFICTITF